MKRQVLFGLVLTMSISVFAANSPAEPTVSEKATADRAAAERRVREVLQLPMVGSSVAGNKIVASTAANEGEIIGTLSYAFGAIWARPGLDFKERCYITLAVLTAKHQLEPLGDYVDACLRVGIASEDILEVMLQVSVYAGVSAATSGMDIARKVFIDSGVESVDEDVVTVAPMAADERMAAFMRVAGDLGIGRIGLGPDAPPLAPLPSGSWSAPPANPDLEQELNMLQGAFGYGEVWGRKRLGYRNRSMVTMAVLMALLQNEQFHYHVNNALNLGFTPEEIHEVMLQAGVYAGVSCWQNATNIARDVFSQRARVEAAKN